MFENSEFDAKNNKLHTKTLARELAMQYLFSCDMSNELPDLGKFDMFYEEALKDEHNLSNNRYSRKSKEMAAELIANVALNIDIIDEKIREFAANWQWDRISMVERNILRIAVYEMLYAFDVPPIVSINEAVSIARDYSNERSCNFINGILNSIKDTLDRDARTGVKK